MKFDSGSSVTLPVVSHHSLALSLISRSFFQKGLCAGRHENEAKMCVYKFKHKEMLKRNHTTHDKLEMLLFT